MTGHHQPSGDHHTHGAVGAEETGGVPPVLDEAFWEERYRSSHALWSG